MRRRPAVLAELGELPSWLSTFRLSEWTEDGDAPPEDWGLEVWLWRHIRGHERWRAAGKAWLAERGRADAWFELTRPKAESR